MDRAMEGDNDAFGRLVAAYQAALYGFCFHRAESAHVAEELTQESFTIAYEQLGSLRDPAKLGPWLRGIAHNLSRAHLRSRHRRREDPLVMDPPDERHTEQTESLAAEEVSTAVRTVLRSLRPSDRLLLAMFYFDSMRYREIARFLGVPVSTVRNRLHRARLRMKEEIGRAHV